MAAVSIGFRLYVAQNGLCFHCGKPMSIGPARKKKNGQYTDGWTREHIIPVSKGGGNGKNIVLAHLKCNTTRGNADPTEKMIQRAHYLHEIARKL